MLERDGREVWGRRHDIIRHLDPQPGQAIADIGAGTGFFRACLYPSRAAPGISGPWVMSHVRAGEQTVRAEIESAGFELVRRLDFMRSQYWLRFRRR